MLVTHFGITLIRGMEEGREIDCLIESSTATKIKTITNMFLDLHVKPASKEKFKKASIYTGGKLNENAGKYPNRRHRPHYGL